MLQKMKKTVYPKILKCIRCKNPGLVFTNNKKELICQNCNSKFAVSENVPILIPDDSSIARVKSDLHNSFGTSFNYIDHYQKDASHSDYFEKRDAGTEHSERRVRE